MGFNSIQFIGTQRSGSNLLRLILDTHEQISAPHPPHLLKTFSPLIAYYGDLQLLENKITLINDMCAWVEVNPVPWEGVLLDRDKIAIDTKTIIDVFNQIYTTRMKLDKANIWCCKSTFNINYVEGLEASIRPFYIYLYRDGRDVAASFKKAIVGPKHTYHLARKWSGEQKAAKIFLDSLPPERYISLAYEDILEQPGACVKRICEKLRVSYDPRMLKFYASNESRRTADSGEMWKNVLKPVIRNNTGKFYEELSPEDITLFESVAGTELEALGYPRVSEDIVSFESEIPLYEVQNQQMQEQARSNASVEDKENRAPQKLLLQQIHQRLGVAEPLVNPA